MQRVKVFLIRNKIDDEKKLKNGERKLKNEKRRRVDNKHRMLLSLTRRLSIIEFYFNVISNDFV